MRTRLSKPFPVLLVLLSLLFGSIFWAPAVADEVGLYTGLAQVSSQDSSERRSAMPRALEQVLRKLSGLRDFEEYPAVSGALRQAQSIALAYHYEFRTRMMPDGTELEELWLVADFAPGRVDEITRSLGLPSWQPERQPIETWVVVDDGMGRSVLPDSLEYTWHNMENASELRGVNLSWPDADEEGMYPVDPQLLWGGYTEDLVSRPDRPVLIHAVRNEGAQWTVRSYLEYKRQNWVWREESEDLDALLTESTQQAIDQLARASSISAEDQGAQSWSLTVSGLQTSDDYQFCLAALQEISVVERVRVQSAGSRLVTFELALNALPRYLEEALESDRRFEAGEEPGEYRLIR